MAKCKWCGKNSEEFHTCKEWLELNECRKRASVLEAKFAKVKGGVEEWEKV